jgi:signal transduction histidine kinase
LTGFEHRTEEAAAPVVPRPPREAHLAASRSVLIVTGEPSFQYVLGAILRPRGFEPIVAATAEAAVAILSSDSEAAPPVALIDQRVGDHCGIELLARLHNVVPELVGVLMTPKLDTHTAIAALRRGAYDYFDKTSDSPALFAVLDRCFDRVELLRDREAANEALRVAKEEAEAANQAKTGFLATISHELRTPLNAIIGFSEMMQREVLGALGNEQYRSYAGDIHASGTHLLQIINDILDLSKAEAGKMDLSEDVFDLHDIMLAVSQLTANRVAAAGVTETIDIPDDLPAVQGDERKTKQILLNLIVNAVKFTPPGGRITVTAHFEPVYGLGITVADTGIGIAEENLDRVLKPFEQVDSSLSRQHQGTGLGLPLVKAIIEMHGGRLRLESRLGEGTRVTVIFPQERVLALLPIDDPLDADAA